MIPNHLLDISLLVAIGPPMKILRKKNQSMLRSTRGHWPEIIMLSRYARICGIPCRRLSMVRWKCLVLTTLQMVTLCIYGVFCGCLLWYIALMTSLIVVGDTHVISLTLKKTLPQTLLWKGHPLWSGYKSTIDALSSFIITTNSNIFIILQYWNDGCCPVCKIHFFLYFHWL